MATRTIKMPSRAMVELYDMSQEGLEDNQDASINNFTSVYDISENHERTFQEEGQGDKYICTDGEDYSLSSGIKAMSIGVKGQADALAKGGRSRGQTGVKTQGKKGKSAAGNKDVVVAMAGEMQRRGKGAPSPGHGVGRKAFSSMTGYSAPREPSSKGGRLSFKDIAQSARKANTLNTVVQAFREAGEERQSRRPDITMRFAGKAALNKKVSTLSVSGIDISAGVDVGSDFNRSASEGLFKNLPT